MTTEHSRGLLLETKHNTTAVKSTFPDKTIFSSPNSIYFYCKRKNAPEVRSIQQIESSNSGNGCESEEAMSGRQAL